MNLEQWQQELADIVSTLESIENRFYSPSEQSRRKICHEVHRFVQSEKSFYQVTDQFETLSRATAKRSPHNQALVHWLNELAQSCRTLYEGSVILFKRSTWIHQSLARLTGNFSRDQYHLSHQMLLDMKKNYENLKKTKMILSNKVRDLKAEKRQLNLNYQRLNLIEANQEAATSLQETWGQSFHNARFHPLLREIQILLKQIHLQTYQNQTATHHFQKMSQIFQQETRGIMHQAKRLIEQNDRHKSKQVKEKTIHHLQTKLDHLQSLEQKLESISHNLVKPSPAPLHILMKKSQNQGKTIRAD